MSKIYAQIDAAFGRVSAAVVLDRSGDAVATVALKMPRQGEGRLYAYVHLIGVEPVRAFATGYGYDKRSAAVASAVAKIPTSDDKLSDGTACPHSDALNATRAALIAAVPAMDSRNWGDALERAGFRVLVAV